MEFKLDMFIAQLINFWILFWLYKKFLAKPMIEAIEEKRSLTKKLENADQEYHNMLEKAEKESQKIIQEAVNKKNSIIADAGAVAENQQKEILEKAHKKAEDMIIKAKQDAQKIEWELNASFEQWVKKTTELVVKKLLNSDKSLQQEYVNNLIQEATKR